MDNFKFPKHQTFEQKKFEKEKLWTPHVPFWVHFSVHSPSKPPRPLNYPCHVCGIMGHKLTNYPRFGEMQNMFKDKGGQTLESKPLIEVKAIIASINMVDVNVTIRNKTNEE
jgi:hypothetical protein